jgi:hypothetical protein
MIANIPDPPQRSFLMHSKMQTGSNTLSGTSLLLDTKANIEPHAKLTRHNFRQFITCRRIESDLLQS